MNLILVVIGFEVEAEIELRVIPELDDIYLTQAHFSNNFFCDLTFLLDPQTNWDLRAINYASDPNFSEYKCLWKVSVRSYSAASVLIYLFYYEV